MKRIILECWSKNINKTIQLFLFRLEKIYSLYSTNFKHRFRRALSKKDIPIATWWLIIMFAYFSIKFERFTGFSTSNRDELIACVCLILLIIIFIQRNLGKLEIIYYNVVSKLHHSLHSPMKLLLVEYQLIDVCLVNAFYFSD